MVPGGITLAKFGETLASFAAYPALAAFNSQPLCMEYTESSQCLTSCLVYGWMAKPVTCEEGGLAKLL